MRLRTSKRILVQSAILATGLLAGLQATAAIGHDYGAATTPPPSTAPMQSREATPAHDTPLLATPNRGATMHQVIARYGPPQYRHAPVGQPPITRWDYPGYRLYFEYNRVIHAVVPDHPEPLAHVHALRGRNP